jgi:hypothetical protein
MANVPGFAKAFAGRWHRPNRRARSSHEKDTTRMTPAAVAAQASFAHAAEFFNSLLIRASNKRLSVPATPARTKESL